MYVSLKLHNGEVSTGNDKHRINLPEGCEGIMFVFKTKKTAKKFWGKDVPLQKVREINNETN